MPDEESAPPPTGFPVAAAAGMLVTRHRLPAPSIGQATQGGAAAGEMEACPGSRRVNSPRNDNEACHRGGQLN